MAAQRAAIISFLLLCLLQYTACVCNVTCTTDFISSLNCSCSEQTPASSYTVMAECWNEFEYGNGSCKITAPQQWCRAELENFELIVSVDANCSAMTVSLNSEGIKKSSDPVYFKMYEKIKPEAPANIQLAENDGCYNISWETAYEEDQNIYLNDHLIYRVRIRTTGQPFKEQSYTIKEDRRYLEIPYELLKYGTEYMVDVQATVNPSHLEAFWSEWSPTMKWKTNRDKRIYLFLLFLLSVVPCSLLIYFGRIGWLKWLHLYHYIPSPEKFFKPLYHTYQGDFQRWVGPSFTLSEFDTLEKNTVVQVVKVKQKVSTEKFCDGSGEDGSHRDSEEGTGTGSSLASQGSSKHLLPRSSSQVTARMTGHISIHTVTVSGEESSGFECPEAYRGNICAYLGDCEEEALSCQGTVVIPGEKVLCGNENDDDDEPIVGPARQFGPCHINWQSNEEDQELERLSLDSFSSNERSDDGYPHLELDLDTIDSGFQDSDCNSPVDSELNLKKPVLGEAENLHSNYIRQWVTYNSTN